MDRFDEEKRKREPFSPGRTAFGFIEETRRASREVKKFTLHLGRKRGGKRRLHRRLIMHVRS